MTKILNIVLGICFILWGDQLGLFLDKLLPIGKFLPILAGYRDPLLGMSLFVAIGIFAVLRELSSFIFGGAVGGVLGKLFG